jgi:VIT1/CCC1 family predicted Fe2+/Mn2+ transporter
MVGSGWIATIMLFILILTWMFWMVGYKTNFQEMACSLGADKLMNSTDVLGFKCSDYKGICLADMPSANYFKDVLAKFGINMPCFDMYSVAFAFFIVLIGTGIVVVGMNFMNIFTASAVIAIFLIGFFMFPIGIFSEGSLLPAPVSALFTLVYGAAFLFAIIVFARGG